MNVSIRTAAREDILRQFAYYADEVGSEQTARRFLAAVESTIKKLTQMPLMGVPGEFANPRLKGLRSWPVSGFPSIRIYYLLSRDELKIVRVLHGKRDVQSLLEEDDAEEFDGRGN